MALARTALLDALEALNEHLEAVILVGAQAVYQHTGNAKVALAEFTTDGDLAIDPDLLGSDPLIEDAMIAAGFTADPRESALGTWFAENGVPVDLMIPAAVAGRRRRSVTAPPHSPRSMRRTRGLEAALIDNSQRTLTALDRASDPRAFVVSVAGPAALIVAKLHKINDRISNPTRLDNKDAHDIYRMLVAIETEPLTRSFAALLDAPVSETVTREAVQLLMELFATGPDAVGSRMAGAAEEIVGNPVAVAESVSLLARDLLDAMGDPEMTT
tara:strand:+ start:16820 stop:17635 length:816 start_codon:yes stop_codon:yes gene_type:complete